MKHRLRLSKILFALSAFLLVMGPSPAFAHDNLGGDELAAIFWMLVSALVVAAMGAVALIWALRTGQFNNVEESKYTMLDTADNYDAIMTEYEERIAETRNQKSEIRNQKSEARDQMPEGSGQQPELIPRYS
jgi:cbb3-type cytochrome oxidase maturation protein